MTLRFILEDTILQPQIKLQDRGAVTVTPSGGFRQLYIEPTSYCNLNCPMCLRRQRRDRDFGHMDIALFDKIIDELPESVGRVFFCGFGEPFCHPEILYMISRAKERGRVVEIITNGTLLDEGLINGIIGVGLDKLWVSLDSLEEKSYTGIRAGASFRDVMKNIESLNTRRGWQTVIRTNMSELSLKLGVMFVMRKDNLNQLNALFTRARSLGISDIKVTHLLPYNESQLGQICYERMLVGMMMAEEADRTRVDMPRVDIRDTVQNTTQPYYYWPAIEFSYMGADTPARRDYCKFVREGVTYVRWDGAVSPCMSLLYDNTVYQQRHQRVITRCSFGDAGRQSLSEIWDSEAYSGFRGRVERFDFSPCSRCGGCERFETNEEDCYGNQFPVCGPCLWAQGLIQCP